MINGFVFGEMPTLNRNQGHARDTRMNLPITLVNNRYDRLFSLLLLVLWYLCSTDWRKHSNTCQTNGYIYSHHWTTYLDNNETETHSDCRTEIFDRADFIELSQHATDLGSTAMSGLSRNLHRWFHTFMAQRTSISCYPASTQVHQRPEWIPSLFSFHSPQAININDAYRRSNRENLMQAFDFAQKQYGITQLIDPEGEMLLFSAHILTTLVFSRCGHGWTRWEKYFTLRCSSLQSMSHRPRPSISTRTWSSELHRVLTQACSDRSLLSRFIWKPNSRMNTHISPLISCSGWKLNSIFSAVKRSSKPAMTSTAISMFCKRFDRMKCDDSRVSSIACDRSTRKSR